MRDRRQNVKPDFEQILSSYLQLSKSETELFSPPTVRGPNKGITKFCEIE